MLSENIKNRFLSSSKNDRYDALYELEDIFDGSDFPQVMELITRPSFDEIFVGYVLDVAVRKLGSSVVEQFLLANWAQFNEDFKAGVGISFNYVPFPDALALTLADHPSSSARVRQSIVSGYNLSLRNTELQIQRSVETLGDLKKMATT